MITTISQDMISYPDILSCVMIISFLNAEINTPFLKLVFLKYTFSTSRDIKVVGGYVMIPLLFAVVWRKA